MTVSKLLKSCAIPPASVPMYSIFYACLNCCSSFLRSVRSRMAAHPHKPSSFSSRHNLISTGNSLPSLRNPIDFQGCSHGRLVRPSEERSSIFQALFPKPLGNQDVHRLPQQIFSLISKRLLCLRVHQHDSPFSIHHHHGV